MLKADVLMLTRDDALWRHCQKIDNKNWHAVRGQSLEDLEAWEAQEHALVLVDADLPDLPAWDDPAVATMFQPLKVIVATTQTTDEQAKAVLSAGARGYVHAYSPAIALRTVLQTVQQGSVWMGPTLLARLLRGIDTHVPKDDAGAWAEILSPREKIVAERAAMGHSNQAIADALHITERTVRAHLSSVFTKLNVSDRLALALRVHGIR